MLKKIIKGKDNVKQIQSFLNAKYSACKSYGMALQKHEGHFLKEDMGQLSPPLQILNQDVTSEAESHITNSDEWHKLYLEITEIRKPLSSSIKKFRKEEKDLHDKLRHAQRTTANVYLLDILFYN